MTLEDLSEGAEIERLRADNDRLRRIVLAARDVYLMYDWDKDAPGVHEKYLVSLISESGLAFER
jgi:hypothetical protein